MSEYKLGFQYEIGGESCYCVENSNECYCFQDTNDFGFISTVYQPFINPGWTVTKELKALVFNAINDLLNQNGKKYNESISEEITGRKVDFEHIEGLPILLENSVFYPSKKSTTNVFYFTLKGKNGDIRVYINNAGQVFLRNFKHVSGNIDVFETIFLN